PPWHEPWFERSRFATIPTCWSKSHVVWGSQCEGSTSLPCDQRRSWRPEAGEELRIGVLALQGAFREHKQVLQELGAEASEVRKPEHLRALDGLIIPGGEST